MDISLRSTEGTDEQPVLLWDTKWRENPQVDGYFADWVLAGPNAPDNAYGLQSNHALDSAILIALFTWRRAEPHDDIPSGSDPRGWWGDDVDTQGAEIQLGSRLWLLNRSVLNSDTARRAEMYANEALEPLVTQGAVASFTTSASIDKVRGWLILQVDCYSQNGTKIYSQMFSNIWRQEFA